MRQLDAVFHSLWVRFSASSCTFSRTWKSQTQVWSIRSRQAEKRLLSLQAGLPFKYWHSQKLLIPASISISAQCAHITSSSHKLSTNVCTCSSSSPASFCANKLLVLLPGAWLSAPAPPPHLHYKLSLSTHPAISPLYPTQWSVPKAFQEQRTHSFLAHTMQNTTISEQHRKCASCHITCSIFTKHRHPQAFQSHPSSSFKKVSFPLLIFPVSTQQKHYHSLTYLKPPELKHQGCWIFFVFVFLFSVKQSVLPIFFSQHLHFNFQ